jgi:diguanylate cyclase
MRVVETAFWDRGFTGPGAQPTSPDRQAEQRGGLIMTVPATARAIAAEAFGLIGRHGVEPVPENYALWYAYVARTNSELSRVLDGLIAEGRVFDPGLVAELVERFVARRAPEGETLSREISGQLEQVLSAVSRLSGGTASYGRKLERFSGELATTGDIAALVRNLAEATRMMADDTKRMEAELDQAAAEIHRLQSSLSDARRDAMVDALTGIGNRKRFELDLKRLAGEAAASGEPLSLVLGDVDHFKQVNDRWGHLVGDQVLKLVAMTLKDNVKGFDVPCRYGGEEFAVIMPNTPLRMAAHVAENLRRAIMAKRLVRKNTGETLGQITLSFGVTTYRPGEPLTTFVERADANLYQAKHTGRNRVTADQTLRAVPSGPAPASAPAR